MNTTSTSTRSGPDGHDAEASRGVRRGRLTPERSAGLPLLGECLCCWPVLEASPGWPARRSGTPLSAPGAGGGMGNSARPGMRASEPRTFRERSEPERFLRGGSPEEISFGAGPGRREARAEKFSNGPLLFRKAPVQWKTFQGAGVQRVATLWRRGLGTARVPSGGRRGRSPAAGGGGRRLAPGPRLRCPAERCGSGR